MTRHLFQITLLTLTYCFTLASFALWDIAFGIGFSVLALWIFRSFLRPERESHIAKPSLAARLSAFPLLCLMVVRDIAIGTWQVAKVVVGIDPLRQPGIVAVPIGDRSRIGVVVSGIATTLSPGTILIEIDWNTREMLIHVLDARDPEQVRADHERFYQRYQRRVFP